MVGFDWGVYIRFLNFYLDYPGIVYQNEWPKKRMCKLPGGIPDPLMEVVTPFSFKNFLNSSPERMKFLCSD